MAVYIALLRGINVSGKKIIKMEDLRSLLESMGLQQVRTYIQSGNAVCSAAAGAQEALSERISAALKLKYGFEVGVIVKTPDELEAALRGNPFAAGGVGAAQEETGEKRYYSFLAKAPEPSAVETLQAYASEADDYRIGGDVAYILCRDSYGKSQFSNNFLEAKLKVMATTRNEATVRKLLDMGRAVEE
ncbi:DUF1697 domain-containing protein [Paenibacillus mucilaginosus]|uniref:DUF1697 domain-containing protein n=1 Tax=Paenibacillus mucilaginosus (strain KNP414) TaxID=1036673 RepID=F8FG98_PAEMK|nr:DUF1697 domain-containing protein [Paenibacillus mucilaginosus]AEI43918.1 hypothetical protein KNP414_05394 [Paenibacillus mucilaginosus KNP414]MCG7212579.1 DUF1697 domain-containing protein [Paenibacillus mucilaginosus]WDM25394.1 DUF1697 domain-containing protein [Paenibacillus mucilaginosus]